MDGRRQTRTGRIVQFATSVTPEFDNEIRKLARETQIHLLTQKEGISQQKLFERSLKLYQKEQATKKEFISQIKNDLLSQLDLQAEELKAILRVIEEGDENLSLKDYDHNIYRKILQYIKLREKEEEVVRNKSQQISRLKKQLKKYGINDKKITPQDVEK
ncbi:13956_t:CDS:2 [Ambispora leptoticha]|uniref:13956_t:CDS:1 n=1 Tax=Ambispora leptoticha TaxID=144679 RepID=A0A9N9FAV8_9GLOM|nr:13956_t:CDS:2 [Ambispora leptoticha]